MSEIILCTVAGLLTGFLVRHFVNVKIQFEKERSIASMKKRVGRFKVKGEHIKDELDTISEMFSSFRILPVRAEHDFATDTIEYTAYCPEFREIAIGEAIPEYRIIITRKDIATLKGAKLEVIEVKK